jgi:hypothetical protein
LNDLGQNFLRPQLVTVAGAVVPFPHVGKQRQVMIDLNPGLLQVLIHRLSGQGGFVFGAVVARATVKSFANRLQFTGSLS